MRFASIPAAKCGSSAFLHLPFKLGSHSFSLLFSTKLKCFAFTPAAQAWGFPLLAPYLQPGANFSHGANFASAGSGALNTTSTNGELPFAAQVAAFVAFKNATNGTNGTNGTSERLRPGRSFGPLNSVFVYCAMVLIMLSRKDG